MCNLGERCIFGYDITSSITLSLFTKCNLNCEFCFQNHTTNDIDIESIRNIPKLLEDNYPIDLKNKSLKNIGLDIYGGELFSDDIPDSMFDIYEKLANNLIILIRKYTPNVIFDMMFLSNGVNTKHDRILKLLNNIDDNDKINVTLRLSYDNIDRFEREREKELFKNTFNYFYNNYKRPPKLGFTITKRAISKIINFEDEFISSIPDNTPLQVNFYTPHKGLQEKYMPSDDDLFNFYKWAIDNNKFNLNKIDKLLKMNLINKNEIQILGKNLIYHEKILESTAGCELYNTSLDPSLMDYINLIVPNNILKNKCLMLIEKRGCLYCEYKNICPGPCWPGLLTKDTKLHECFIKRTIEYIYNNPNIKDRYNNFLRGADLYVKY